MTKLNVWKEMSLAILLCASTVIVSHAQTFTTLVDFNGTNGAASSAPLIQGVDGGLYGTAFGGGTGDAGTVFRLTSGGAMNTISFCLQPPCSFKPFAGLVLATDGDFYGATAFGGGKGLGEIFKLSQKGALTTLYSFCVLANCTDGISPYGSLLQATNRDLYGTTISGGANGFGSVFKVTLSGTLTTLHSFSANEGSHPGAGLVQGPDGNLYGTTSTGGNFGCGEPGCGSIYKITPRGALTILHLFCSEANCADGAGTLAPLVQANDGNFYGTTISGGAHGGGTVFEITPGGQFRIVHDFCAESECGDGSGPEGGLLQGIDGSLYGTTTVGGDVSCGSVSCGTIFKITAAGTFTTLHSFKDVDGEGPVAGLLQATNGVLYGTTQYGGTYMDGTIFSLDVGLSPFVSLVRDSGGVGSPIGILGQGFTGTTDVSMNGTVASFTVVSDTYLTATVPVGATTGFVTVTTPSGTLTSNRTLRIKP